jgi:hypothetical protein
MRTPGSLPVVTSMSSSKVASGRKDASMKRLTYIVAGNQFPMTRWSRNIGSQRRSSCSVASRKAVT